MSKPNSHAWKEVYLADATSIRKCEVCGAEIAVRPPYTKYELEDAVRRVKDCDVELVKNLQEE